MSCAATSWHCTLPGRLLLWGTCFSFWFSTHRGRTSSQLLSWLLEFPLVPLRIASGSYRFGFAKDAKIHEALQSLWSLPFDVLGCRIFLHSMGTKPDLFLVRCLFGIPCSVGWVLCALRTPEDKILSGGFDPTPCAWIALYILELLAGAPSSATTSLYSAVGERDRDTHKVPGDVSPPICQLRGKQFGDVGVHPEQPAAVTILILASAFDRILLLGLFATV